MSRGVFITFEGGEGSGKSTQLLRLVTRLRAAGHTVAQLREPGGTAVGDRVRDLLLDPEHTGLGGATELLLYEACRAELVEREIRPRLDAGEIVVCDRFSDSTTAYQGYGRGIDLERIRSLNEWASGGLGPDVTVLLDIDPAEGLVRACRTGADRLESEALDFHERVRRGFLAIAAEEHARFVIVDGTPSADSVEAAVWAGLTGHPAVRPVLH